MLNQAVMSEMLLVMENQFTANATKNIFCNTNYLTFDTHTLKVLPQLRNQIDQLSYEQIEDLAYRYQDQFLNQFYQVNQYMYFDEATQSDIRTLYLSLLNELKQLSLPLEEIQKRHYQRISSLIKLSNPLIYKQNHNPHQKAQQFVCAQYSGEFLCELFNITKQEIKEPVLDIGCGAQANLVTYLLSMGIETYGIDRNTSARGCLSIDWFAYDYGFQKWNTIISNLSFTSHFLYHHLQEEEIANLYASTYMNILASLQKQGQWIYAPSIPFFEELLPEHLFQIERTPIHQDFSKTVITKR